MKNCRLSIEERAFSALSRISKSLSKNSSFSFFGFSSEYILFLGLLFFLDWSDEATFLVLSFLLLFDSKSILSIILISLISSSSFSCFWESILSVLEINSSSLKDFYKEAYPLRYNFLSEFNLIHLSIRQFPGPISELIKESIARLSLL